MSTAPRRLTPADLAAHPVVSREEWLAARKRHLAHEKEYTRMRDRLSEERRALPWVRVDETYRFDSPTGPKTLAELFGPRSQLFVYHFMMAPGDAEGCPGCSFLADHLAPAVVHLEHHDVSVVMVSRAPLEEIQRYQRRMGWQIPWVSSQGSRFNHDFHVSFTPEEVASGRVSYNYADIAPWGEDAHGISTFYRNAKGEVFHTYSSYARGGEVLLGAYAVLDMMPLGRNETGEDGAMLDWMRRHDAYDDAPAGKPAPGDAQTCCAV